MIRQRRTQLPVSGQTPGTRRCRRPIAAPRHGRVRVRSKVKVGWARSLGGTETILWNMVKQQPIRLLALDIDGTLTDQNFQVSARNIRSEEHTSELQSQFHLVCRLLLEKKKTKKHIYNTYTSK